MSVYFIQAGTGGPIKIGHSSNARARIEHLKVGTVDEIIIHGMIDGDRRTEADLHERFAEHRKKGEWFAPAPEILEFCRHNCLPVMPLKSATPGAADRQEAVVAAQLAHALADALQGVSAKTVAHALGIHENTVKNWKDGKYAPAGPALILLMREYPKIFRAVLALSGRAPTTLTETQKLTAVAALKALLEE